jgi:hypothetical protein
VLGIVRWPVLRYVAMPVAPRSGGPSNGPGSGVRAAATNRTESREPITPAFRSRAPHGRSTAAQIDQGGSQERGTTTNRP